MTPKPHRRDLLCAAVGAATVSPLVKRVRQ
ncbi:hypothetical protein ABH941_006401 [Streptacidiphilus sp. EB103A]